MSVVATTSTAPRTSPPKSSYFCTTFIVFKNQSQVRLCHLVYLRGEGRVGEGAVCSAVNMSWTDQRFALSGRCSNIFIPVL